MSLVGRILDWLQGHWERAPEDENRARRSLRYTAGFVGHCARELEHDRARQLAAALTYHSVFSVLPMAALVLLALNAYLGPEGRAEFKETVIEWVLRPVAPSESGTPAPQVSSEQPSPAEGQAVEGRRERFEESRALLDVWFERAFKALEQIDFGSIGLVGLLLFIWGATGLLATVERSFDTVYGAIRTRPWYRRLTIYYSVITLGPLVLLAGIWLRSRLVNILSSGSWTHWLGAFFAFFSPFLTTWMVIFLMYLTLPNTKVTVRAAALGSVLAAAISSGAVELFRIYVSRAAASTLYGALALIPLSLLWVYLTWLIILFGLEVSYTLQSLRQRGNQLAHQKRAGPEFVDPRWVVPVAARVANAFGQGRLSRVAGLEEALDIPGHSIRRILVALEREGLVRRVEDEQGDGFTLARPAASIGLAGVLGAGRRLGAEQDLESATPAVTKFLRALDEAAGEVAADQTLADLMEKRQET